MNASACESAGIGKVSDRIKESPVRTAKRNARALLRDKKNRLLLRTISLLLLASAAGLSLLLDSITHLSVFDRFSGYSYFHIPLDWVFMFVKCLLVFELLAPLALGAYAYMLRSARGQQPDAGCLFQFYTVRRLRHYAFRRTLSAVLRLTAATALIIAVSSVGIAISEYLIRSGSQTKAVLMLSATAICCLSMVVCFIVQCFDRYLLTALMLEHRSESASVIRAELRRHRPHLHREPLRLYASFILLFLLSVLSAGLVFVLYAAPYFISANASYGALVLNASEENE